MKSSSGTAYEAHVRRKKHGRMYISVPSSVCLFNVGQQYVLGLPLSSKGGQSFVSNLSYLAAILGYDLVKQTRRPRGSKLEKNRMHPSSGPISVARGSQQLINCPYYKCI